MFAQEEIAFWENEQAYVHVRKKQHKDPRREKLRDFRKGIKGWHFDKESKSARKFDYQLYRVRMKRLLRMEQYDIMYNYRRTGGWITW